MKWYEIHFSPGSPGSPVPPHSVRGLQPATLWCSSMWQSSVGDELFLSWWSIYLDHLSMLWTKRKMLSFSIWRDCQEDPECISGQEGIMVLRVEAGVASFLKPHVWLLPRTLLLPKSPVSHFSDSQAQKPFYKDRFCTTASYKWLLEHQLVPAKGYGPSPSLRLQSKN